MAVIRWLLLLCICSLAADDIDQEMQDVESIDSSQVMDTEMEEDEMQMEESEEVEESQEFDHEPNSPG